MQVFAAVQIGLVKWTNKLCVCVLAKLHLSMCACVLIWSACQWLAVTFSYW